MNEEKKAPEAEEPKVKMIDWEKPDGSKITTNDLPATLEKAKELGWKRKK